MRYNWKYPSGKDADYICPNGSWFSKHHVPSSDGKRDCVNCDAFKEFIPFLCPICGSKEYEFIIRANNCPSSCRCKGCTVQFGNPEKFGPVKDCKNGN